MARHKKHEAPPAGAVKQIEGPVELRVLNGFVQGSQGYQRGQTIHRSEEVAGQLVEAGLAVIVPTDRQALVAAASKLGVGLVTTDKEVLALAAAAKPVVATFPRGAAK